MDRFIAAAAQDKVEDDDLVLCPVSGWAYQREVGETVPYDSAYFDKCRGYEGKEIARAINSGRITLVDNFIGPLAKVLDIGIGSGEFIARRAGPTWGRDVNPAAVQWLKNRGLWAPDDWSIFSGFTFWDVIEHVPEPERYLAAIPRGRHLFASLPIFADLWKIRESRHYRPNEHLYYWTENGFVRWMDLHGFRAVWCGDFETRAGRESIRSFAFLKDRAQAPDLV